MNRNEDSSLSAFFDDELDPAERRRVGWSVESHPETRERLRDMAATRRAIAGLSRPACPVDMVDRIVSRIGVDQERRTAGFTRFLPRVLQDRHSALPIGLGLAASLFLALGFLLRTPVRNAPIRGGLAVDRLPKNALPVAESADPVVDSRPTPSDALIHFSRSPVEVAAASPTDTELRRDSERRRVFELLDTPGLRRILIEADVLDDRTREIVNNAVRDTARKHADYGRISLVQGLAADPTLPNEAEVFAVVVDDRERSRLLERLKGDFPDATEDASPAPELAANLVEVGHVEVLAGTPAAGLVDPLVLPRETAIKESRPGTIVVDSAGGHTDLAPTEATEPEAHSSRPSTAPAAGGKSGGRLASVLIWVTARKASNPGGAEKP